MRGTKTVITFHLDLLNSKISHQRAGALNNSDNISSTFYLLGTTARHYGKHYIVKIATTISKCNRSYSKSCTCFCRYSPCHTGATMIYLQQQNMCKSRMSGSRKDVPDLRAPKYLSTNNDSNFGGCVSVKQPRGQEDNTHCVSI